MRSGIYLGSVFFALSKYSTTSVWFLIFLSSYALPIIAITCFGSKVNALSKYVIATNPALNPKRFIAMVE
jgi:hypothetical protein